MEKVYLGDSVYLSHDGFHWILTTENGHGPSNTIYMDPEVTENFLDQLKQNNPKKRGNK